MSELREKVARAIAQRNYSSATPRDLDEMAEGFSEDADAAIAAVLEAMQEPSPAMLDRFVSRALCVSVSGDGGWSEYGRNQWATMLEGFRQDHGLPPG